MNSRESEQCKCHLSTEQEKMGKAEAILTWNLKKSIFTGTLEIENEHRDASNMGIFANIDCETNSQVVVQIRNQDQ
ncbi:hypothetical protein X798_00271 [Onchocerca flexuosa]|uniref:Chorein_N domain-containing protein n=2 Tax=Onchocerca flexuosa TaxID=387005 RepID=A0A183HJG9_9BILA|nr:hypothetical protein X798_00271 [Onchocerca flexuosa]VDO51951.1 unnamed protein product [Onchocerca flexuosa]